MYRIIYMGGYNESICNIVINFKKINIEGIIIDQTLSASEIDQVKNFFIEKNIPVIELKDITAIHPDMIFVCGYTKIINSDLLDQFLFVNIHAGILPKWRGTSANSWAIINGEKEVGYSFHRVTEELDGGEIFHKIIISLGDEEKYAEARNRLNSIMHKDLESIFLDILNRKNEPEPQNGEKYIYCSKFHKTDGEIHNWNQKTSVIFGFFRVMGYPYGTGLFLFYKNKKYEILEMKIDSQHDNAVGISGAILLTRADSVLIKTLDGAVEIGKIRDENGSIINAAQVFRIGNRL